MRTPEEAYREAADAVGREHRPLELIVPIGAEAGDRFHSMLVLVDGWILESGNLPAIALLLKAGRFILGHTYRASPFLGNPGLPKLFEGTQGELEIGDESKLVADYSTNGTLVVPGSEFREIKSAYLQDLPARYQETPLPRILSPHDVLVTQYAALVYVTF